MKLTLRNLFKGFEVVDASVIDQNVDLAERFLRLGKKALDVFFLCNIALDRNRFSTALRNFINDFVRTLF